MQLFPAKLFTLSQASECDFGRWMKEQVQDNTKRQKTSLPCKCNTGQQMENGIAKSRSAKSLLVWRDNKQNTTNTYSGFYQEHQGFFKHIAGPWFVNLHAQISQHKMKLGLKNETIHQMPGNELHSAHPYLHPSQCTCKVGQRLLNQALGMKCRTETITVLKSQGLRGICTKTAKSWHLC